MNRAPLSPAHAILSASATAWTACGLRLGRRADYTFDWSRCKTCERFVTKLLSPAHDWTTATKLVRWPHCRRCGIIRRRDGKNSPECKGAPQITLREPPSPAAGKERT